MKKLELYWSKYRGGHKNHDDFAKNEIRKLQRSSPRAPHDNNFILYSDICFDTKIQNVSQRMTSQGHRCPRANATARSNGLGIYHHGGCGGKKLFWGTLISNVFQHFLFGSTRLLNYFIIELFDYVYVCN